MFAKPKNEFINNNKFSKDVVSKWKTYNGFKRELYHNKGNILNKNVHKYLELDRDKSYPRYKNKMFDEWQNRLSKYIHEGYNVIVDVKTSCGKTWAVNQIVSYETLCTMDSTALVVIPNQSILLDTVGDICENHTKKYKSGKTMLNFSTRKWSSMDGGYLNSQILCLTADIVLHYLDNRYINFFKNIKYIVFDEVHLPEISSILWKLSMLPYKIQLILLSATIGDITEITDEIRKYRRDRGIRIIKYDVRPIPLQRILFKKGIGFNKKGLLLEKSELDGPTAFTLQINPDDPTPRDIKKMMILSKNVSKIPNTREEQYILGKEVSGVFLEDKVGYNKYIEEEREQIRTCVKEATPHNILTILQNLFARGMGPVLIFHPNPLECVKLIKQMTAILGNIEDNDDEVRENLKLIRRMEKRAKRKRDKVKWKQEAKNFNEAKEREKAGEDITIIPELCNKWRFPHDDEYRLKGKHIPEFIRDGLDYGIGIHIESMKHSLKRQIFNMFRKKEIVVLIADVGLSVGVNLPARSVILTGNITPTLYRQMGGRAGRRGMDNQGYILPLVDNVHELLHAESEEYTINKMEGFSFIDTIQFNNDGYDSLKYSMLVNYVKTLDKDGEALYLEKYRWLKRSRLIDCKWTKILIEMDVDRIIYFIFLLNKGLIHHFCDTDESERIKNLMLLLAYFMDPGLQKAENDTDVLPPLPDIIKDSLKPLDDVLSDENKILDLEGVYSNYIYQFFENDTVTDIKRIAAFQLKLFQFVKIIKEIVLTKYYHVERPDLFYETLIKLDTILWSKCYKMRGVTSGLY